MVPFQTRQFFLASCLAGLIGIIWYVAYSTVTHEVNSTTESEARRARQLSQFFEGHADDIFRYSDNYVKSIRQAYKTGSTKAVQNLIKAMPPDSKIVSHVTVIDKNGKPLLVSGQKIKPGSSAKDRAYFKFQKTAIKMTCSFTCLYGAATPEFLHSVSCGGLPHRITNSGVSSSL